MSRPIASPASIGIWTGKVSTADDSGWMVGPSGLPTAPTVRRVRAPLLSRTRQRTIVPETGEVKPGASSASVQPPSTLQPKAFA